MTKKMRQTLTLYGNVGADPETHTIPAKEVTREFFDPLIDDVVTRPFTKPEQSVRNFSIAVSARGEDGEIATAWVRCADWDGHSFRVRKGDRVRVTGYFTYRRYEKDGELKTARTFVVRNVQIEKYRLRDGPTAA